MSNPRNINQLLQGAANSQAAQLPGIPAIQVQDRALADVLRAFKERLEVREGERGNPFESVVTRRELDELGIVRTAPSPCRVTDLAGITGQTKAGEFVQVELTDLADAVKLAAFGGAAKDTAAAQKEALDIKADLEALAARVAAFGEGGPSGAALRQLEVAMAAKAEIYDAAILVATAKIAQYDAAIIAATAKITEYDAAVVAANAKFAEYDQVVTSGTAIVNGIDQGTRAIVVNPNTLLYRGGTYAYTVYVAQDYTTTDLMAYLAGVEARLAAHGI